MNSNSMRNMYKNNASVLIQERFRLNVSQNLAISSSMVVFWANVMNEQWQINNLISWKFLFKTPSVNPKKTIGVRQVKSLRSRKLNRSSTWQKINFKCTLFGFSLTLMSKCRKRPWNLYKYKNSLLKAYFSLIIEYRMYLGCLQKPRCLAWFKTSQAVRSAA